MANWTTNAGEPVQLLSSSAPQSHYAFDQLEYLRSPRVWDSHVLFACAQLYAVWFASFMSSAHHIQGDSLGVIPYSRFDTSNSSYSQANIPPNRYEESATGGTNNLTRQLLQSIIERRLQRALRRLIDEIQEKIRRRCEMRLLIVLRLQFVFRYRSRIRAAITIQRFMRPILHNRLLTIHNSML